MKFETWAVIGRDARVFKLEINGLEFMMARLDAFDRALLKECETSGRVSDKLLALECLARRIEEEKERNELSISREPV